MNKSDTIAKISKSLSILQGEIEDLHKDKKGYGYKYADLAQCLKILRPLLLKNGLAITQIPGFVEDRISLETVIMHESGEWISGTMEIPVTVGKGMIPAQACGSTISYARRYALISIFGISAEDDDLSSIAAAPIPQPNMDGKFKILKEQIDKINELLEHDSVRIEKMCKVYGVKDLEDFNQLQAQDVLDKLMKMEKK